MILGLDMSTTKVGFSIFSQDGELDHYGLIRTAGKDFKSRVEEIYYEIEKIITSGNITFIVMEDTPVNSHSNLKVGKDLSVLQGLITGLCFKNSVEYKLYMPSAWRSIIGTYDGTRAGMKRDIQKQKAIDIVNELYGLDFVYNKTETKKRETDDDKAEAILIGLAYIKEQKGDL